MALIVPTSYSTYADAARTEGHAFVRKYVLAQFRSDADLGWLLRLRTALGVNEVKYAQFRERRPGLKQHRDLWAAIERGKGQATLVIVDPEPLDKAVRDSLVADGAVEGEDFGETEIASGTALALVAGTPVAWLPTELAKVIGQPMASLAGFAPADILKEIGASLRAAQIFAARAHATFDVAARDDALQSTRDVYQSPLAAVILRELLATPRTFDVENEPTIKLLNNASDEIARALSAKSPSLSVDAAPLVREADSRSLDFIQAADVAAGIAYDIINTSGLRPLGEHFERVWINGQRMRKSVISL